MLSPQNTLSQLHSRSTHYIPTPPTIDQLHTYFSKNAKKLYALQYMEETGGEPALVWNKETTYTIIDTSLQTPKYRRSVCYDKAAFIARKKIKPRSDIFSEINELPVSLLTEDEYFTLQSLITVDTKSSSWLQTPKDIRSKGGALFGDHHYGRTFIHCNSAESFFSNRGFRVKLEIIL